LKQKIFRLPPKLAHQFEDEAKRLMAQGEVSSENDLAQKALAHFLICKNTETVQSLKLIVLRYPAKCLKCKKQLEQGSWAWWGRGVGVICTDCEVMKYGDKAIVRKLIKLKELQWQIKSLDKELDVKAEQFKEFNFYEILQKMHQGNSETHKMVMEYLRTSFEKPEDEKKALDEIGRLSEQQGKIIQEMELFMKQPFKKKKKKKVTAD